MPPKKGKGKEKGKDKGKAALTASMAPPKPKKIPPPPARFTNDDIIRFKELYKAHDEDNIDKIPLAMIPLMLRKLGFNPKTAEIQKMFELFLEDEFVDTVEFHEWLFMVEAKIQWGDDFEAAVFKAFAALGHDDKETGICDFEKLREELFTWGEPLTDIEFIDWIRLATRDKTLNVDEGTFAYTKFVENMNAKDSRFLGEPINYFKLDQKTLAELAIKKAAAEKEEAERKEAEKKARAETKRQKMIEAGLILEDEAHNTSAIQSAITVTEHA